MCTKNCINCTLRLQYYEFRITPRYEIKWLRIFSLTNVDKLFNSHTNMLEKMCDAVHNQFK